jgi:hypothetical protein
MSKIKTRKQITTTHKFYFSIIIVMSLPRLVLKTVLYPTHENSMLKSLHLLIQAPIRLHTSYFPVLTVISVILSKVDVSLQETLSNGKFVTLSTKVPLEHINPSQSHKGIIAIIAWHLKWGTQPNKLEFITSRLKCSKKRIIFD